MLVAMAGLLSPLLLAPAGTMAQQPGVFQPPKAYDVGRYEAGWDKNPFTLKTVAAPAAVNANFASGLAIGSYYGAMEDPTVVLVNVKTHQRFRLKKGQSTDAGMTLAAVNLSFTRREAYVEVKLGDQTARVKFDEGYLRQVAAAAMKAPPVPPPPSRVPSRSPVTTADARAGVNPGGAKVTEALMADLPPALRGILPATAFGSGAPSGSGLSESPSDAQEVQNPAAEVSEAIALPIERRRIIMTVQH